MCRCCANAPCFATTAAALQCGGKPDPPAQSRSAVSSADSNDTGQLRSAPVSAVGPSQFPWASSFPPLSLSSRCRAQTLAKNLRAVLLLGYSKLESTVRYLGIEVDDALEISEQTEI